MPQQFGGFQPQGPVLLVGPVLLGEQPHRLGHIAAVVEGGLQEPFVIFDLIPLQIGLHPGNIVLQAKLGHGLLPLGLGPVQPFIAKLLPKGGGQLPDVLPLIAVLREGHLVLPQNKLLIPGVDGNGKLVDLVAGVVDIELPPHVIAQPLQHGGQSVSQHAAPGIADVHGTGGIGGDKLHHHPFPFPLPAGAVGLPGLLHGIQGLGKPLAAQGEVEKAGAGHLHLVKIAALQLHMVHEGLGNVPGGLPQRLGGGQGKGGGVIAVFGILGDIHLCLDVRSGGKCPGGSGLFIGAPGQGGRLFPGGRNQIFRHLLSSSLFSFTHSRNWVRPDCWGPI